MKEKIDEIVLSAIGVVESTRQEIKDDDWDSEESSVVLNSQFSADSLKGLDSFSHVEVFFYMDRVSAEKIELSARRPRNNPEWPEIGIFSQRGKNRPNQIGHTICEIAEIVDNRLVVKGLDAIDGTPVLDLKPWVNEFGPRGDIRQPSWITELMRGYWKHS